MISSEAAVSQHAEAPYYVKALAMGLPAVMLGLQISGWIFFLPVAMHGHADFRQLYVAGYMVRTGHSFELFNYAAQKHFQDTLVSAEAIALPFIRPAYQALLFVPFSVFPYRAAYFLFLAINVTLLVAVFRTLRPQLPNLAAVWEQLPIAVVVSFLPAGAALVQEQDSILLLLLLSMVMVRLQRGSDFSAGMLIGSALFKFQVTIPIAILFLCWKRWRLFAGFCFTGTAVSLLSVWMTGIGQARFYLHSLLSMSMGLPGRANDLHYSIPMKLMMNFHGLIYGIAEGHVSSPSITAITLAISAIFFFWAARSGRSFPRTTQLVIAVALAVLVSFYIFIHDLVILEIPILISLESTILDLGKREWRLWLLPALSAILFAAPALILAQAYLLSVPLTIFVYLMSKQPIQSRRAW